MIKTKDDLRFYLAADKFALKKNYKKPKIQDLIWKYQIYLRKSEYFRNQKNSIINKLLSNYYNYKKFKLGVLLGFDIGDNVFGPGLRINHFGNIVVSPFAKVGMWCDIHEGVNIGEGNKKTDISDVPSIGDNVWIGPGVKIYGNISIGDSCVLGANSVVNKSYGSSLTIAGVPGKVINQTGTEIIYVAASLSRTKDFFSKHPEYLKRNL
jgi:serine O-acetyltransferase